MPVQHRIITRREALSSRVGSPTRKAYAAQVHKILKSKSKPTVTLSRAKALASPVGSAYRKAYAAQVHKVTGGGGSGSRSEAARKAWQTRRGH